MKTFLFILLCFLGLKGFSQTNDVAMVEKSSTWIKIPVVTTSPKRTTTIKKKTATKPAATPKKNTQDEFEKTNSEVNRFKKVKKG